MRRTLIGMTALTAAYPDDVRGHPVIGMSPAERGMSGRWATSSEACDE